MKFSTDQLNALCETAKEITGKVVLLDEDRNQSLHNIHAFSFQDIIHEIGHWLAASEEERLIPNLGFDTPETDADWANAREFQAICYHSEIVRAMIDRSLIDEGELEYILYLESVAELVLSQGESNLGLHRHLARPKATEVAQAYMSKLGSAIG